MYLFIVLALVVGTFASEECTANAKHTTCGTACPLTCENYRNPPRFCVLKCVIGCECEKGYVRTKDGSCVLPENCPTSEVDQACLAEPDAGRCRGHFPMYYYDAESGTCQRFIYGGCGGNGNRYQTEAECLKNCGSEKRSQVFEETCEEEPETGLCRGYFPMWYYDVETGTCQKFVYGGCGGNGNRYATEKDCLKKCGELKQKREDCDLEAETGVCKGNFPRYAFDRLTGECKQFVYGGCGGNGNNFLTATECEKTCKVSRAFDRSECIKPPETGVCKALFIRFFFNKESMLCERFVYGGCGGNKNNFETEAECYDNCGVMAPSASACHQEKEVGPCKAAKRRYFFNKETGQCERFIYGGCQGNENNFRTKDECESTCSVISQSTGACHQEKEVGPCKAGIRRFFFNKETGQCERFLYGGCKGNENNFRTKDECESTCLA